MKVFVIHPVSKIELVTLFVPRLRSYLELGREKVRSELAEQFRTFLKEYLVLIVRFEDECFLCGKQMEAFLCCNRDCSAGYPSDSELKQLMIKRPREKNEQPATYVELVRGIWRKEGQEA